MRMEQHYSHFNGLEFLLVHKQDLWREIEAAVRESRVKGSSKGPKKTRRTMGALERSLREYGWRPAGDDECLAKGRIAIRMRCKKRSLGTYGLLAPHWASFVSDVIDVGIEVLPMKELQEEVSSGVLYYEGALYNLIREGRGVPAVPLILVGVAP